MSMVLALLLMLGFFCPAFRFQKVPEGNAANSKQITCYTGDEIHKNGFNMNMQQTLCDPGQICKYVTMPINYGDGFRQMKVGACISKMACSMVTCHTYKKMFENKVDYSKCRIKCCDSDLCGPSDKTVHQTVPNPVLPHVVSQGESVPTGLECYNGIETTTRGTKMRMAPKKCGSDEICSVVYMTETIAGVSVSMKIGKCLPKQACLGLTCNDIAKKANAIAPRKLRYHISKCDIVCCDKPLCLKNNSLKKNNSLTAACNILLPVLGYFMFQLMSSIM